MCAEGWKGSGHFRTATAESVWFTESSFVRGIQPAKVPREKQQVKLLSNMFSWLMDWDDGQGGGSSTDGGNPWFDL